MPRYRDESGDEPDIFVLSDNDALVPERDGAGKLVTRPRTLNGTAYTVRRYRPRIEGPFARIEQWRADQTGRSHWRVTSIENVTSIYGFRPSANSCISDPFDPDLRIFSWLPDTTFDDKGNIALYDYLAEDGAGVPVALFEQHRGINTARYPKSVRYGNRTAYYADLSAGGPATPLPSDDDWMFQAVFDFGDHNDATPGLAATGPGPCAPIRSPITDPASKCALTVCAAAS